MKAFLPLIGLLLIVASCKELPQAQDPKIIDDLPSMITVADSLNAQAFQTLKWSIQEEEVVYAMPITPDWKREFQAFLKDDVNRNRFKDAYIITDSTLGNERTVKFTAKTENQEIRIVIFKTVNARLTYYYIEKSRDNVFSNAFQSFEFNGHSYSISVNQNIPGVFNNQQIIFGQILPPGNAWQLTFDLGDNLLPVTMIEQETQIIVVNGAERLNFNKRVKGDTIQFMSSFFNGHFLLEKQGYNNLTGTWVNDKNEIRTTIPVRGFKNRPFRFNVKHSPETLPIIAGEHMLLFQDESNNTADTALLFLTQFHHHIEGSILTTTGDYRFLVGSIKNDSILLSTMDGTHAYLFTGKIINNQIVGVFHAGSKWRQKWTALLNKPYTLPKAEKITRFDKNVDFTFQFPNELGEQFSLSDERFKNKVVLVSIMGTWCSNCLDETLFLKEVQKQYVNDPVEVVALDFEITGDSAQAKENLIKYKNSLGITYPLLLAGLKTTKSKVSDAIPGLDYLISYPTLLILDKQHKIARIHTGFSGPATGQQHYSLFKKTYFELLDSLVKA